MCFHSKQTKSATTVANRWQAKIEQPGLFNANAIYNGHDYPSTPVITKADPFWIKQYYWGLIPAWAKDESIKEFTLNARIETLTEKPSFKNVINNRCLVIVDGFYEWQSFNKNGELDANGKIKKKYLLSHKEDEPFAFAGLYNDWINPLTNEIKRTYTIVTTEASELMALIHNSKKRMPITLTPQREDLWLNGLATDNFKNDTIDLLATAV